MFMKINNNRSKIAKIKWKMFTKIKENIELPTFPKMKIPDNMNKISKAKEIK